MTRIDPKQLTAYLADARNAHPPARLGLTDKDWRRLERETVRRASSDQKR